jgi:hypothetical protein
VNPQERLSIPTCRGRFSDGRSRGGALDELEPGRLEDEAGWRLLLDANRFPTGHLTSYQQGGVRPTPDAAKSATICHMLTPISHFRRMSGAGLVCGLVLSASSAYAQAVPGTPGGEWLAYDVSTLPSEYVQRCAIPPAMMAQWRKTLDDVAAVVATSPALVGLTGHTPRLATGVDVTAPIGGTDCTKYALAGYVAFWPWLEKHVEPDPAARPGGPKYRLRKEWVNNGIGVLWISLNKIPSFAGSPWEKDERGVFFE